MKEPTDRQTKKANGGVYCKWTHEESNELLAQLVEASQQGLWIRNRQFPKHIIENRILPKFNSKQRFRKTYVHYKSRWGWYKNRYNTYRELLRSKPRFGWDPILKKFTATEEDWDDFCKSDGKSAWVLRTEPAADYDKLCLLFGGVVVDGGTAFSLRGGSQPPPEDQKENNARGGLIEDIVFDGGIGSSVPTESDASNNIVPIVDSTTRDGAHSMDIRDAAEYARSMHIKKQTKYFSNRNSSDGEGQSTVKEIRDLPAVSQSMKMITSLLKRKKNTNSWDAIKEVPELDMVTRFAVIDLVGNKLIRGMFCSMTPEERLRWITFKLKLA